MGRLYVSKKELKPCPSNPNHLPQPIKWGIENVASALSAYVEHMRANGHNHLEAKLIGFMVHPMMGWLGASPDAHVIDQVEALYNGIAEFKCPYTKKDLSPSLVLVRIPNFTVQRKTINYTNSAYHHQVQL